jgi:gliding motility-associated-like protein
MPTPNYSIFPKWKFIVLGFLCIFGSKISGQKISYIIPDLGTPSMNTYIEIIGPHNAIGNFGNDGLYLNNGNDSIQVRCLNPADSDKIKFGPISVSWLGRMISTQVFVMPENKPNSSLWYELYSDFRIPVCVSVNGNISNTDTFYIVRPQAFIFVNKPNTIIGGSNSPWVRSRRGSMIVDSIVIQSGSIKFSLEDCDPYTSGNQGYLPVNIISANNFSSYYSLRSDTAISLSALGRNGGPGGGGGGAGEQCGERGGNGYTGGGGNDVWKLHCSSGMPDGEGTGTGSFGLNNIPGGANSLANEGGGGGTGHPFGKSGNAEPPYGKNAGQYGAGSGGMQNGTSTYCGGGGGAFGGNGTDGAINSGGKAVGNPELVPFCGGSGGGGGNTCSGEIGGSTAGGGGGALKIFAKNISVINGSIAAQGADGLSSTGIEGSGGGGSGGAIYLASKLRSGFMDVWLCGGNGKKVNQTGNTGGFGGGGRLRLDGPISGFSGCSQATYFGPGTDTLSHVGHTFTLHGTCGNSIIQIFIRPLHGAWKFYASTSGIQGVYGYFNWSQTIKLPCSDSIYLLVVAQKSTRSPTDTGLYRMHPDYIFSQAATNFLYVKSGPAPLTKILSKDTSICKGEIVQLDAVGGNYFQWSPIVGLNNSSIYNPEAKPAKTITYTVTSYNIEGCFSKDSIHINVKNGDVLPNVKAPALCKGQSINLSINGSYDKVSWNTGDTTSQIVVHPSTSSKYWYKVDKKGCILVDTILVKVVNPPIASFTQSNNGGPAGILINFNNKSLNAVHCVWDFGDNTSSSNDINPKHFYTVLGKHIISLIAIDTLGCSDTAYKFIDINDSVEIFIPNAFSPNSDGINDKFEIKSIGIQKLNLIIYNRWGELVFQNEINDPGLYLSWFWDGTCKGGKALEGTYIYLLRAKAYDGQYIYKNGYMTLIR